MAASTGKLAHLEEMRRVLNLDASEISAEHAGHLQKEKRRWYARGEITPEQFEGMRRDLNL